jgi:ketosteroid isomerase-like protein
MRAKLVILLVAVLFVAGAVIAFEAVKAQTKPTSKGSGLREMNTQEQVEAMLRNFLAGVDTPAAHDRFWSDRLIYTGASGTVKTKQDIMKSVNEGSHSPKDPNEPKTTFDAQDIKVKDYGDFAIVNFQLVAHSEKDGKTETANYRNTGTLHQENGEWKVVAWQATKIEPPKADEKK